MLLELVVVVPKVEVPDVLVPLELVPDKVVPEFPLFHVVLVPEEEELEESDSVLAI